MEKLNVAIVDDNPLILNTLDELINAEDGLSVIGKADNGQPGGTSYTSCHRGGLGQRQDGNHR